MVKKYYDDHEGAYRTIREKGEFGWQAPTLEDFKQSMATDLVTSVVKKHFKSTYGKTALDLGCGTGPTAQTLHSLGFQTTGIDISPTAIELAQKMSSEIHFEVADVLTYQGKFDFIYDSHCYHCIVLENDRLTFLNTLKRNLRLAATHECVAYDSRWECNSYSECNTYGDYCWTEESCGYQDYCTQYEKK